MKSRNKFIGMFDSGVGGLSVLKEINKLLPKENILYLADQAHVPYGSRDMDQIQKFSIDISNYFIEKGAKLIVVACNTASAAALKKLRAEFPEIPFVGMEPAVKPAAEKTETGVVGVLATQATFQGALYSSVVERFAKDVEIIQDPCIDLVQQIEMGHFEGAETEKILENALLPMIEKNIDTIVLGCTHFPFVFPTIKKIVGPNVRLINPAPAVANQVLRLLRDGKLFSEENALGEMKFLTTGKKNEFSGILRKLGFEGKVEIAKWGEELILSNRLD